MPRYSCNSQLALFSILLVCGTSLTSHRSVPTHDQILVPETLLKKRKSQEKAREERSAELEKKKKVSLFSFKYWGMLEDYNDA
jgi:hypothetical protein